MQLPNYGGKKPYFCQQPKPPTSTYWPLITQGHTEGQGTAQPSPIAPWFRASHCPFASSVV